MDHRQVTILFTLLFVVLIYFKVPIYNDWFQTRMMTFAEDIPEEMDMMDIETRKEIRWLTTYTAIKSIKKYVDTLKIQNALVLIAPKQYYKKYAPKFIVPEPVISYYFSGLKTTVIDADDVYKANCCLIYEKGQFVLKLLANKAEVEKVISIYKENI